LETLISYQKVLWNYQIRKVRLFSTIFQAKDTEWTAVDQFPVQ